jgi:hypothetical protein
MKRSTRKLALNRETLRNLEESLVHEARGAAAGAPTQLGPTCAATICQISAACGPTHNVVCTTG